MKAGSAMLKVMKFGAAVLRSVNDIVTIANRVEEEIMRGWSVVVVVTAMQQTTRSLQAMAREVTDKPHRHPRELDMLLTAGERISMALLAQALIDRNVKAVSFLGQQAGVETSERYSRASVTGVNSKAIEIVKREIVKGRVPIIAGFQGTVPQVGEETSLTDEETSLGRGGADVTAVVMAIALEADLCEICTDVGGVYAADPKLVPQAKRIRHISYEDMLEIAGNGQHLLSERVISLAMRNRLPLRVTSLESREGTTIEGGSSVERAVVTAVPYDETQALISLMRADTRNDSSPGAVLFGALADAGVVVDHINQSRIDRLERVNIDWTVPVEMVDEALEVARAVARRFDALAPSLHPGITKVKVVGAGMNLESGVAAKVWSALDQAGIRADGGVSSSDNTITLFVPASRGREAVQALHDALKPMMLE